MGEGRDLIHQPIMKLLRTLSYLLPLFPLHAFSVPEEKINVVLITATAERAFLHGPQISSFTRLIRDLSYTENWNVTEVNDTTKMGKDVMQNADVLVFGYTGGDILNAEQEKTFEQYVRAGGSVVGVHSPTYTEGDNPFFVSLTGGGKFNGHPPSQPAELIVHEGCHPSTVHLPPQFKVADEWYCYHRNPVDDEETKTLISIDTNSYQGKATHKLEGIHPMTWSNEKYGGRHWFTSMGHTMIFHQRGWFVEHIRGAIKWAGGQTDELEVWQSLFDGKTLEGWHTTYFDEENSDKGFIQVNEGSILLDTTSDGKQKESWLISDKEYGDFELRFKMQSYADNRGNSGVQVRSRIDKNGSSMEGPQIDIHPPAPFRNGLIYDMTKGNKRWIEPSLENAKITPEQAPSPRGFYWVHATDERKHVTGASPGQLDPPQTIDFLNATDEATWEAGWNNMMIRCEGTRITTFINETMITNFEGEGILNNELHTKTEVGMKGHIAFQIHKGNKLKLRIKDIEIRELSTK